MHKARGAGMAASAMCSGRGEPVHPCERAGGGWGGVRPQGQAPAVPPKERGAIHCLCTPSEGVRAELAVGGGTPGPPLRHGHSSPFLCAAGNLRFLPSQRCAPLNCYQMWVPCASH